MSCEFIFDLSMLVVMVMVSIVGVGDGWSSLCLGYCSLWEGVCNDDLRVVVVNLFLNVFGEVFGGSGNCFEVFIG